MIFLIEFQSISKRYDKKIQALKDVSFKIHKGDFVFLIGPSGAGKSTILKLILKEIEPDRGKIYFKNQDITKVRNRRIPNIRKQMGVVFQDFRLLEEKTVAENLNYAMDILGFSRINKKRRLEDVLELVNLSHRQKSYPRELSGGEQQRISIARAMSTNPDFLIADEPTGNLDPETSWDIVKTLEKINRQGTTVLMITHAKEIVDSLQKRVIHIENGEIIRDIDEGTYHEKL